VFNDDRSLVLIRPSMKNRSCVEHVIQIASLLHTIHHDLLGFCSHSPFVWHWSICQHKLKSSIKEK